MYDNGLIIYKRSFNKININEFQNTFQWFSLEPGYGIESYGPIVNMYHLNKNTKLLDIGKINNRKLLIKLFNEKYPDSNLDPNEILDPNEQYSGGQGNKIAHRLIKKVIGDKFDGTIINELDVDDPELEGPTEVVLWNFQNLTQLN
jgi:hypothetical protein